MFVALPRPCPVDHDRPGHSCLYETQTPPDIQGTRSMPLTLHIEPAKDLVYIEATGTVTLDEVLQLVENLSVAGTDIRGRNGIIDASRATGTTLTFDSVRRVSDQVTRVEEIFRGTRWAIVATSDVMFGIARIYETLRMGKSFEVRAFRSRRDAELWINEPKSVS